MRLIDADKMNLLLGISDRDIYAKYMIGKMPTVYAVPVVRCRECKWWHEDDGIGHCDNHDGLDNYAKPEDFCSYGERKEGAGNEP